MAATQRQAVAPAAPEDPPGFLIGVLAAASATAAMLILGLASNQPTVAELVADAITAATPVEIIEGMIATFGSNAKRILFASVLLGQIAVGGALGLAAQRARWSPLQFAAGVAGIAVGVGLAVLGTGIGRGTGHAGAGPVVGSLLLAAGVFAAAYAAVWRALHPTGTFAVEEAAERRVFLKKTTIVVIGLAGGIGALRWLIEHLTPPAVPAVLSSEAARTTVAVEAMGSLTEALAAGVPGLARELTPNDAFYTVSKNVFRDPAVNEQAWRLEVTGLVARPMALTYEDMRRLPASNQYFTLQCISNEVGGELIGNADWRGIALNDLLRQAGLQPGAVDVILRAADDYSDSIPIEKALQPGTMLAYEMNGEVLPRSHGFPVRLLVPDIYGMKNVKWITRIEVVEYDYKGYWQHRGWSDVATMQTTSRVDVPKNASFLRPGRNYVGGIAVAGQRGIQQVEVSTDGGRSWAPATVKPALGPNTWVLWLYTWDMPETEAGHKLLVRATDGTGVLQTATVRPTIPDGSSGYHAVTVRRAEG